MEILVVSHSRIDGVEPVYSISEIEPTDRLFYQLGRVVKGNVWIWEEEFKELSNVQSIIDGNKELDFEYQRIFKLKTT